MAGYNGLERPFLTVIKGYKTEKGHAPHTATAQEQPLSAGNQSIRASLKVLQADWLFISKTKEFQLHQPQVIFAQKQLASSKLSRFPVYVLRRGKEDFLILDMKTRGEYEYRILEDGLYIRRLIPQSAEKQLKP